MRKQNLIVLGSALILALALLGVSRLMEAREAPVPGPSAPSPAADAGTFPPVAAADTPGTAGLSSAAPQADTAETGTAGAPVPPVGLAEAYLVVTVNNTMYQPIPMTGEASFTITQKDTGAVNVVHITEDSVYMENSTCPGHDCMKQGTVTLDNRGQRVLGNMIICLPNRVTLELHTPEEAQAIWAGGADMP